MSEDGNHSDTSLSFPELGEVEFVPAPARVDLYLHTTIDGRYVIEDVLGEGGMGVVYRARHRVIDKKVAVKILRGEMARDREMTERFVQEAKAASSIGNAHIVDVSDYGELLDGTAYFVMEFLDGVSLASLMAQGPVPVPRLVHIAKQIAQGLHAAHVAGIVHRDLKPDNVFLVTRGTDRDFVKILDFGIAKVGGEASRITRAGSVFGTPHYMSPEQAAGAPVDSRTDIYALGVILYEMACGKVPFDADNFMGILTQHMYKAPVPIRALVPEHDIPAGLDAIVLKSLTKRNEGRYQTMDELVADLEKLEKGQMPLAVGEMMQRSGSFNVPADYFRVTSPGMPTPVPGLPSTQRVPRRRSRWPLYTLIAAVGTISLAAIAVVLTNSGTLAAPRLPPMPATAQQGAAVQGPGATAAARATPGTTAAGGSGAGVDPASLPPATAATDSATPVTALDAVTTSFVFVEPSDAKILRNGKDVGVSPLKLTLKPGETATLTVSKAGFAPQTVVVKSGEETKSVKLVARRGGGGTGGRPSDGKLPDDFSDPWSKPK